MTADPFTRALAATDEATATAREALALAEMYLAERNAALAEVERLRGDVAVFRAALEASAERFDAISTALLHVLHEPGRTPFWIAVDGRDAARAALPAPAAPQG